jgi:uncharacterized protein
MSSSLTVQRDVEISMRDGVILKADLYLPHKSKQFPVLLQRTPYGKGFSTTSFALWAAESGYAVLIQDTRGRWASGGDGTPFISELQDGYDTLEWISGQIWSNGKVGMWGESYLGFTQLAAAASGHLSLKTIIPGFAFSDPRAILYQDGAVALGAALSWGLLAHAHMAIMRLSESGLLGGSEAITLGEQLIRAVDGLSEGRTFRTLPLEEAPLVGRHGIVPFFAEALSHPPEDNFWKTHAISMKDISIPALHVGGWYDIFITSTIEMYAGLHDQGSSAQKLLIGPWTHADHDGLAGEIDFGLSAYAMTVLPDEIQLEWFDHWLKGEDKGLLDEAPVRFFLMGENRWQELNTWPPTQTQYLPYYLHSSGSANSLHGDGSLNTTKPSEELNDTFVYDPRNPVPTRGGSLCCWRAALSPGAFDQRPVEERSDVLVYTTPPLEQDLKVIGPIQVLLWAASSAPDTDFTAKLVDVSPNGYARNLVDGILRASYRDGPGSALLEAEKQYLFKIELGPTANLFKMGHRLRLEISSSNFPRFDRNLNTGQPLGKTSELVPAFQTVFHDAQYPSHILLPVVIRT